MSIPAGRLRPLLAAVVALHLVFLAAAVLAPTSLGAAHGAAAAVRLWCGLP